MSRKRTRGASQDFAAAATDTASVGLSLFPLGISFGILVVHTGLAWWWAPVFTAVIYAGSLEFLLLGLVATVTPLGQIAVTALLVNLRHVFYALSFPLARVRPLGRLYATFALTDEAYALTTGDRARCWSSARILWMQVLCQGYWVGGATVGALAGSLIPFTLHGLDFALTALFVVLTIDAWRAQRDLPAPLLAATGFAAAALLAPGQVLPVAMALFTAGLLVRYAVGRRTTAPVPGGPDHDDRPMLAPAASARESAPAASARER
ncbi:AzlC family ABC transporter permease [Streptosporangium roseum]|uniref:Branched-chain amino acid permease (Azaleucine resistance)-like protein n=1 Tax=Streptosporangium roseum (strain ATCC 12428 / DSM 43021 / JCM 3005 / KCTC 9067 / NCIMB 10171 / NRRL 2505 / NI 9100) TaxID=479432 RepID=D2AU67_STRRD|nr:AzlC family ABC transporter permease [Streptosporangium roseum]ACZ90522.1 branched-chain amino acid permease (azaleucine resistance)-like protein [Streptosporangium roseum DSM 43021]